PRRRAPATRGMVVVARRRGKKMIPVVVGARRRALSTTKWSQQASSTRRGDDPHGRRESPTSPLRSEITTSGEHVAKRNKPESLRSTGKKKKPCYEVHPGA